MLPERNRSPRPEPTLTVLDRFFRGLSESIFQVQLGVTDVQLIDYLSELLSRFVRSDLIVDQAGHSGSAPATATATPERLPLSTGRPSNDLLRLLAEADKRIGVAKRELHRHVGDFALFWSGMYPEALRAARTENCASGFLDYCQQGKRAYRIAAEIEAGDRPPQGDLLWRLSEQFELCAYGLREIRREWENDAGGQDGLLI